MNEPLVSIIIPVYNGEKYIEECLDSILDQDYKNIEVIVVNDGSVDNTKNIVEKKCKKNNNIKLINQKNSGVSCARNNGINNSNGEYLSFVDSDDCLSSHYISRLYEMINENNADMALFRQPKRFIGKFIEHDINDNYKVSVLSGKDATLDMLFYKIAIGPWNKLIKKSIITDNNICFDKNISFGEGFNFSIDCYQKSKKVACSNEQLYYYRLDNPDSVMTKFSEKQITGSIHAQYVIQSKLDLNDKDYLNATKYSLWHTECDCLNSIIGSNNKNKYKNLYKDIKKKVKKEAKICFKSPISKKEKIKGLLYLLNPFIASKFINKFRKRKYTK